MNCPTCGVSKPGSSGFEVTLTHSGEVRIMLMTETSTGLSVMVNRIVEQTDFLRTIKPIVCALSGRHKDDITEILPPKDR